MKKLEYELKLGKWRCLVGSYSTKDLVREDGCGWARWICADSVCTFCKAIRGRIC